MEQKTRNNNCIEDDKKLQLAYKQHNKELKGQSKYIDNVQCARFIKEEIPNVQFQITWVTQ